MKIEISSAELKTLDEALECWMRAGNESPGLDRLMTTLMGKSLGLDQAELRKQLEEGRRKQVEQTNTRRRQATLLRAKFYQAEAVASEHEVSETPENSRGGNA